LIAYVSLSPVSASVAFTFPFKTVSSVPFTSSVALANTGALFAAVTLTRLKLDAVEVANRLPDASVALTVTDCAVFSN
jgi:hypothetical protein